jgi:hypothetical protein
MGIETLNSAARAAGFAMASSEELFNESKPEVKLEPPPRAGEPSVQKAPTALAQKTAPATEWIKGVFSVLGRRAPA